LFVHFCRLSSPFCDTASFAGDTAFLSSGQTPDLIHDDLHCHLLLQYHEKSGSLLHLTFQNQSGKLVKKFPIKHGPGQFFVTALKVWLTVP